MQSQFDVTSYVAPTPAKPSETSTADLAELLRQILEVQRDQLTQLRQTAASQDAMARWREDFPELPDGCRKALPILEKAYGSIVAQMVEELRENGADSLDTDFGMQDFLDRYGMRLGQLGNILNLVGPLAEAGSQNESS